MKKSVLSIIVLGSFGLYAVWQGYTNQPASFTAPVPSPIVSEKKTTARIATVVTTPSTSTTPAPVIIPKKKGQYADGQYTGSVADAYYGNVQVQATISNGRITDVQFLDYPHDRSTSRRINSIAMPSLTQEAISAQSANVNGVSGASDTSAAFEQSLASALAQARA